MAEDLEGQTLLGKYRIVGQLGQGGMGSVWRGAHVRTGRKVAIKVLDERFLSNSAIVQRFGREARAASAIQHPGIVEVLDLDQTARGVPFLVMELLEGETLAERIQREGRLSQDESIVIMGQLLEALDAAHAHGVVHRDLKPDNVVLIPRGQTSVVKILDFGISQKDDERVSQLTLAGSVLGTPHYMAPEQAMGEEEVDGRADVYAAGVVMYECVVGDVPFDAPNYNRLIQVILTDAPTPPTERGAKITPGVEEVILRALEKDRDARPQTAGAMLEMLQAVTSEATAPFDRETLGFVREEGAPKSSRTALASTMAEEGEGGAGAPETPAYQAPSSVEIDLPELDMSSAPAEPPRPATPPPSVPPSPDPTGGPSAHAAFEPGVGRDDPLSFEAELDRSASGAESLDIDERALARSSRPPRRATSMAPGVGTSSPGTAAAEGRSSVPPGRVPSYGRISVQPPPADDPWYRRVPSGVWYGLGGLVLIGAIIFGLRALVRPGEPKDVEEVAPVAVEVDEAEAPAAPAMRNVEVHVRDLPPGARLELDGLPAGRPPLTVREGSTHTLEISAPGYQTRTLTFTADGEQRLSGRLEPEGGSR